MKRILLITAVLFTSILSAQDWAPFKASDTLVQFKDTSVSSFQGSRLYIGRYIQSIHVKSNLVRNADTIIVFNKGFSNKAFNRSFNPPASREYLIKGRLLGDTAIINSDSSIFRSIDTNGFQLNFPHRYRFNKNWRIGTSDTYSIDALVDSIYTGSIDSFGLDSLARIKLFVVDTNNQIDPTHKFHNASIVISKKHGLIQLIDFTELDSFNLTQYKKHFISNVTYNANDYNVLSTNDEYHYEERVEYSFGSNTTQYITNIINDTTVGTIRTMTLKNTWNYNRPPNNNNSDTVYMIFDINEMQFDKKSMVVDDTNITNHDGIVSALFESTTSQLNNLFELEMLYFIVPSQKSTYLNVINFKALPTYSVEHSIGFPLNRFHSYKISNQTITNYIRIEYIKKGNQSWGNPYSFAIGLEENSALASSIQLYPNPVKDIVNIKAIDKIQRVRIYTIDGKLQLETQNSMNIDVSCLQSGLYLIEITTDKNMVTKRLIKE